MNLLITYNTMKQIIMVAMFLMGVMSVNDIFAQGHKVTPQEQEILDLSNAKWQWMSEKDADKLAELFHENSVFVHMGGAWGKEQEVNIIRGGMIHYKNADVKSVSVRFAGKTTAVVLCDLNLLAVVGGREVTNHFMATEVYVKEKGGWKLASLSFTKLSR